MRAADYLRQQILVHCALFFTKNATRALKSANLTFTGYINACALRENCIAIPTDIELPKQPEVIRHVEAFGTTLTLWNSVPKPNGDGWSACPSEEHCLWYRHESGTVIPAWNLFENLLSLLTFGEEISTGRRDPHGRFVAAYSPRHEAGLLDVPAFNEAVAALVSAAVALSSETFPAPDISELVRPPALVLSHDCDQLAGNDRWTQAVRAARVFLPLRRARAPKLGNFWWIARNALSPRDFYFDNVLGMMELERMSGFSSTMYVLNGTAGRFGARSDASLVSELAGHVPSGWDIGMHYNYDTHLDDDRFGRQKDEAEQLTGRTLRAGRAHYLRFDPAKSLAMYARMGIEVDESAGYPDAIGYRCGLGGCFRPFNAATGEITDIIEVPMNIMELTLIRQFGKGAIDKFASMLGHLSRVGGAMSFILHPGYFHNPEYPEVRFLYNKLLTAARTYRTRSFTAVQLADAFKKQEQAMAVAGG